MVSHRLSNPMHRIGKALPMHRVLAYLLAWALIVLVVRPCSASLPFQQTTLAPMLEKVIPGVVNISTRTRIRERDNPLLRDPFFRHFFDLPERPQQRESQSLGSGVIVDADKGFILTNHHVIDKAHEITVTLNDGRAMEAQLVGSDSESDVAVIRIDAKGLTALRFGDSDRLRVGDFVLAIGNPFGLSQTVTSGIVSALGRTGLGIEGYEDFIQTDASINPGNSGGALVNLQGGLIGLNTAIVGPNGGNVGIGFAIPINMAGQIMAQIIEYGEVRRGQLGVHVQDLNPELAKALGLEAMRGALIAQVIRNSAAHRAALQPEDLVLSVNGRKVDNASDLRNAIGLLRVDQSVKLEIIRKGTRRTITARLKPIDAMSALTRKEQFEGVKFTEIDPRHPLYGRREGVMISEIDKGSAAAYGGLRPGDIVSSINRRPVKRLKDIPAAVEASKDELLLKVHRGDRAFFLLLR